MFLKSNSPPVKPVTATGTIMLLHSIKIFVIIFDFLLCSHPSHIYSDPTSYHHFRFESFHPLPLPSFLLLFQVLTASYLDCHNSLSPDLLLPTLLLYTCQNKLRFCFNPVTDRSKPFCSFPVSSGKSPNCSG